MDQLSSCYFCGGALDASLAEYPVVPKELQSEGGSRTVVLCRGCREKLATIIEEVVAATDDERPETDVATTDDGGFEPLAESSERATTDDAGADRTDTDDGPLADAGGTTDTGDGGGGLLGEGSSAERSGTEATPSADDRPSEGETGSAGEPVSEGGTQSADTTGSADDSDGPSLTRLEYNKVMRLLQNREFPVERAEIREVATSAYQISPAEFDAVIDAAIERDLIAERNGQFVSPE